MWRCSEELQVRADEIDRNAKKFAKHYKGVKNKSPHMSSILLQGRSIMHNYKRIRSLVKERNVGEGIVIILMLKGLEMIACHFFRASTCKNHNL
jgi:hypothetical protein